LRLSLIIYPLKKKKKNVVPHTHKHSLFGLVLMNDCSARGIQAYEYVPLGPFTGKNWCTVISPWIVTMAALEEFRTAAVELDNPIEQYLVEDRSKSVFNIDLTVKLQGDDIPEETVISKSNLKYLYWSFEQQTAHHSVSGCNMRPGDLIGSGTISGPDRDSYGSILELSWKGTTPLEFKNGVTRKFLQDNDTVKLEGHAQGDGYRIGFGECVTKLLPATPQTF
jgi:fumarylacetoacetase